MKDARLIVDMSSVCWTSLFAGTDQEFGRKVNLNGRMVQVNSAYHGFNNAMNMVTHAMRDLDFVPYQMILVQEGGMSKARRRSIYAGYKDETKSPKAPEAYEEFNKLRIMLEDQFRAVGATVVHQDGIEGDDVIAYLCEHLEGEKVVLTNDGDLAVLTADPNVILWRQGAATVANPFGEFDAGYITLYKALVGDDSDTYPGASGFGPKAFANTVSTFGHDVLPTLEHMIVNKELADLQEDAAEFKPFQKIIDNAEMVYTCYALARLRPEWVNHYRQPLRWKAGLAQVRNQDTDHRLAHFCQQKRLVTAANFDDALAFYRMHVTDSPVIAFDIETTTPFESDEWLRAREKGEDKVDQFGSDLTGFSVTFGRNNQYTYYVSVAHRDTDNVTARDMGAMFMRLVPKGVHVAVHNSQFELTVMHREWADYLQDKGWHGFLPNVVDTLVTASYVDENLPGGLKKQSSHWFGYEQTSYDQVTTKVGTAGTLPFGGRIVSEEDYGEGLIKVTKQYKMNELTGLEVMDYGADDSICTAGLYHFHKLVMEIEHTWNVMLEVEQKPAYVTALGHNQGVSFSLERMRELEAEDQAEWDSAWAVVREYLISVGWEGSVCPQFETLDANAVKTVVEVILGLPFVTRVRTPSKMAILMRDDAQFPEIAAHQRTPALAGLIEGGNLDEINKWVKACFKGEPTLDTDSPKKMAELLYDVMGLPIRIVGRPTDIQVKNEPALKKACYRFRDVFAGKLKHSDLTKEELALVRTKAKADETAVDFAVAFDTDHPCIPVVKALQRMKKVETRMKLYYRPYPGMLHWKDGKIHASARQCGTVTRRYSFSDPNLQQLPKKGEGVKFRRCFIPHRKDAVVVSLDFSGQELRQGAAQSGDQNMLACYIGDNLKDIHSMTSSGAMPKKWGAREVDELCAEYGKSDHYDLFMTLRKSENKAHAKKADDLRKDCKNVNFAAAYDSLPPKIAETVVISVADAEDFLSAKHAMFPRFEVWKEEVRTDVERAGYATTCLGARRHLAASLMSPDKRIASKAGRQGPNYRIQGSSAEQTKLAMGRLWDSGLLFSCDMRFFAPVHDELVFSVHRGAAVESIRAMNQFMAAPYGGLEVPFLASISLGANFGDQIECGDEFDTAAITDALEEVFETSPGLMCA